MSLLASDNVKKILLVLATVNGALFAAAQSGALPPTVALITGILANIFAGLGIVSGGTTNTQPPTVLKAAPAPAEKKP